MKYLKILMLCFLLGCSSVPEDPTPAPLDNNLFTLEMASCDKRDVGILACPLSSGGNLEVPLWGEGEYQITSNNCNFSRNTRYDGDQVVKFSYQDLWDDSQDQCVYDVKVFIDGFDKGFRGQFLIIRDDFKSPRFTVLRQEFDGMGAVQIREGASVAEQSIQLLVDKPGTVFWSGCRRNDEKQFDSNPKIKIKEFIDKPLFASDSCILTIGIEPEDGSETQLATLSISIFDKPIVLLPEPSISYKRKKLKITADRIVAALGIGNEFKIKKNDRLKKMSAKVKKDQTALVRLATANGRFMLLKVRNGKVIWKNFLRY